MKMKLIVLVLSASLLVSLFWVYRQEKFIDAYRELEVISDQVIVAQEDVIKKQEQLISAMDSLCQ